MHTTHRTAIDPCKQHTELVSGSKTYPIRRQQRSARKTAHLCAIAAVAGLLVLPPAVSQAATPASSCTGIQVNPSLTADGIQQLVNKNPNGTVFCFASGTYVLNRYITLKESNKFICPVRRSCVLTGLDKYRGALTVQYGTAHQLIKGFVVERFVAVAGAWPNAGLQVRAYGVLEDNEVRFNQNGVHVDSNQTIIGNFIHHNRQYGIGGGPGDNILIENNEVSWNNTARYPINDDAGGSKIAGGQTGTNYLTWRRNYVHHNYGHGIWSDGNVRNATYEDNTVENNGGVGIFHELSWDAMIRNNILRNNYTLLQGQGKSCWWGSAIHLNNSQNVTIKWNTVEAVGTNAICAVNSTRSASTAFPQSLANISVQGNVIKMRGVVTTGMVGDKVPPKVVFSGNTYYVDSVAKWTYTKSDLTRAQWQAAGQDLNGTFLPW